MERRFYDLEFRPVVVLAEGGRLRGLVWRDGAWRDGPALAMKAAMEGAPMSEAEFVAEYPQAELALLPGSAE